ncbi:MAG: radical SAM family heme chaperone HemW, partial [Nitrospinaceae bacterium]|nr:radical SAM family heme chaperone HemW [Nitrospinaceae bacterium]
MNQKMLTDPNENVSGGNVNTLRPQPLGLYIHIPYCIHKCGYCDFNSHLIDQDEMGAYVDALLLEMDHYAQSHSSDREVQTLFLGGGTPTTLPISQLVRILESAEKKFCFASNSEITFEANPATIGQNQLKSLRRAGYNRISIGVQSFNKTELTLLDRAHGVEEIHCTIDRARGAGFDNLSLDLIFAIPEQTLERWEDNLHQALDKNPQHLSTYNLTIEPETAFWKLQSRRKLTMPNEEH